MTECSICGSTRQSIVRVRSRLEYRCCDSCGHCGQILYGENAAITFELAQQKYYGSEDENLSMTDQSAFDAEVLAQRVKTLGEVLGVGKKILEVGPGGGHVSKWFLKEGYDVTAIEHSPLLANRLAYDLKIKTLVGEFESLQVELNCYDAVCSFHVIEHVRDPVMHLEKAFSVVRPGGFLIIATPNSRSWQQLVFPSLSPNFDSAHLCVFSIASLRMLSESAGWHVALIKTPEYSIEWLRVMSKALRRVRGEDEEGTAGKYAKKNGVIISVFLKAIKVCTYPFRLIQSSLGYGNEIFLIMKKPDV